MMGVRRSESVPLDKVPAAAAANWQILGECWHFSPGF